MTAAFRAEDSLTAASQGPRCAASHSLMVGLRTLVQSRYSIVINAIGLVPVDGCGLPMSTIRLSIDWMGHATLSIWLNRSAYAAASSSDMLLSHLVSIQSDPMPIFLGMSFAAFWTCGPSISSLSCSSSNHDSLFKSDNLSVRIFFASIRYLTSSASYYFYWTWGQDLVGILTTPANW